MRLEESIGKDFLVQLVGAKLETAAASKAVAEVKSAVAASKVAAKAALRFCAAAETPVAVVFGPT